MLDFDEIHVPSYSVHMTFCGVWHPSCNHEQFFYPDVCLIAILQSLKACSCRYDAYTQIINQNQLCLLPRISSYSVARQSSSLFNNRILNLREVISHSENWTKGFQTRSRWRKAYEKSSMFFEFGTNRKLMSPEVKETIISMRLNVSENNDQEMDPIIYNEFVSVRNTKN